MEKFTLAQVQELVTMQDELNQVLEPNWKHSRWLYNMAIKEELLELANVLGYKWWKSNYRVGLTNFNKRQAQLEAIDVLHFHISKLTNSASRLTAEDLLEKFNAPVPDQLTPRVGYELALLNKLLDGRAYAHQQLLVPLLMSVVQLTPHEVVRVYRGKWALNKLRWANGYATGEYQKMWPHYAGVPLLVEDNDVLEAVLLAMPDASAQEVLAELQARYAKAFPLSQKTEDK